MSADRDDLRWERDRFVAFAFSAAELLLEVDEHLTILYAAGANSQLTGRDASTLVGTPLIELFIASDRKLVRHALERLGSAGRLEPISVRLGKAGRPAILGACSVPSAPRRRFVSLVKARSHLMGAHMTGARGLNAPEIGARDEDSGTWSRAQFFDVTTDIARQGSFEGRDDRLTVFQFGGLEALRERAGESAVSELLSETGAYLRAQSVGGDAVGRLTDDRYGIVHDASVSADRLSETIVAMAQDADPSGIGLSLAKGCMSLASEGMSVEDIGKVIAYALQTFSEQDVAGLDTLSMTQAFDCLVQDTASRLTNLKQTVALQNFQMVFQPIVTLADRSVHHYEVLSRFPDTIRPAETVQFAEQVGLIEELDLAVCQYAISVIQGRLAQGDSLQLAVNVSGRSLGSGIFVRLLNQLLATMNGNRSELLIEVTETARLENLEEARNILQNLRDQGHIICLDDFGSGAASYRYMQALPVDFVKIDGSYVHKFLDSSQDAAIIRSMISLSRELKVRTIAEMVETEAQAGGLKSLGVDLGQGWLFGKPQKQVPTTSGGSKRQPQPAGQNS
ncbi:MAG: EAL domain-containing protein [Kiloniellales bacterium]